jgi:hypothetical protein
LNEAQKAAVVGLCGESNVAVLVGRAGAGKTTTMRATAEIYAQSGARVIGMSLSAVAAENLGSDANIESRTIASWAHARRTYEAAKEKFLSFDSMTTDGILKQLDWYNDLKRYENSQLKSGDVIVVDEAGMAGTADWNVILNAAEKFGAKIIAVGDKDQFKAVGSGDCFRYFAEKSPTFELNEIRRQKIDWMRDASVKFAELNAAEALAQYENNGRVQEVAKVSDLVSVVAEKYLELEKEGTTTAVLCYRNSVRHEINDAIRELKKERGELGADVVEINGRKFAVGDRIMFLENNGKFNAKNGETAVVKSFDAGILSAQAESGVKSVDTAEYDKIDRAYAITFHKSQGKTFDNTIVIADKAMDAKATYVAMTRHRENVEMYYAKSDFGSFRDLIGRLSGYRHKDLAADYGQAINENKMRVCEYKNALLETISVLKDINVGQADWGEYREIKAHSLELGKEIAADYDSHKLYLNQLGITKEKLEISLGLKQRPLSLVELSAKNTVELYGKSSAEARALYKAMKKEQFDIARHRDYGKYREIREMRNDLAKEILANYPLHREFVSQFSREYFISRKTMENQTAYAERTRGLGATDAEIRAEDMRRAVREADRAYAGKSSEPSKIYADAIRATVRDSAQKLSANKAATRQPDASRSSSPQETLLSSEAAFFQKLEKAGARPNLNYVYAGAKIEDCAALNKSMTNYELFRNMHLEKFGYAPHVSKGMVYAYGAKHGVSSSLYRGNLSSGYASMLLHRQMKDSEVREPTMTMVEDGIKQTLCFQALRKAEGSGELTAEKVAELTIKAAVLAEHITDKNIRALNDKDLMKEALYTLGHNGRSSCLENAHVERVIELNHGDRVREERQLQQTATTEHAVKIERMHDVDMSR